MLDIQIEAICECLEALGASCSGCNRKDHPFPCELEMIHARGEQLPLIGDEIVCRANELFFPASPKILKDLGSRVGQKLRGCPPYSDVLSTPDLSVEKTISTVNRCLIGVGGVGPGGRIAQFRVRSVRQESLLIDYLPSKDLPTGSEHFILGLLEGLLCPRRPSARVRLADQSPAISFLFEGDVRGFRLV